MQLRKEFMIVNSTNIRAQNNIIAHSTAACLKIEECYTAACLFNSWLTV